MHPLNHGKCMPVIRLHCPSNLGNEALRVAVQVHPLIKESLDECKEVFGGKVALFSNSAGLEQFDPEGATPPPPSLPFPARFQCMLRP